LQKDFRSAPITIRLSCRYSNGSVVSHVARALACDDSSLRVLSAEGFEAGVRLNVLAPFLDGVTGCRVVAAARSSQQPAYFELELRILEKPRQVLQVKIELPPEANQRLLPEELAVAARDFATRLEQDDKSRFSEVFGQAAAEQRPLLLTVVAASVALLLQGKELVDLRHLAETLKLEG